MTKPLLSPSVREMQDWTNRGIAWHLEGAVGRAAMAAIEDGACILGPTSTTDYWGNRIPSRDDVKPGTKGSYDYCADRFGTSYANALKRI